MKKLFVIVLFLFSVGISEVYSQEYKDRIILNTGDTLKCIVTLINDYNIFFKSNAKNKNKIYYKPVTEISSYILDSLSKPEIIKKPIATNTKIITDINNESVNYQFEYFDVKTELVNSMSYQYMAGLELKKASDNMIAGVAITSIGTILASLSLISKDIETTKAMSIIGGGISLIGGIVSFTAVFNIGNAGKILMKNKK